MNEANGIIQSLEFGGGYSLSLWKNIDEFNAVRNNEGWRNIHKANIFKPSNTKTLIDDLKQSKLIPSSSIRPYGSAKLYRDSFFNGRKKLLHQDVVEQLNFDLNRVNNYLSNKLNKLKNFEINSQKRAELKLKTVIGESFYRVKDDNLHFSFLFNQSFELKYVEYYAPINLAVVRQRHVNVKHPTDVFYNSCGWSTAVLKGLNYTFNIDEYQAYWPVIVMHGYWEVSPAMPFTKESVIDLNSLLINKDTLFTTLRSQQLENYGPVVEKGIREYIVDCEGVYMNSSELERLIDKKSGALRRWAAKGKFKKARKNGARWEFELAEVLEYLYVSIDIRNKKSLESFFNNYFKLDVNQLSRNINPEMK